MSFSIRPFTPADYPELAQIRNANWPDNPVLPETLEANDKRLKPGLVMQRLIAERDGVMLGNALFFHMEWMYHPQKFYVGLTVDPAHQRKGIGTALYQKMMEELQPYDPIKLVASTRADKPAALRFAEKRGFIEEFRAWESKLELAKFDPAQWAKDVEKVLAQGYQIKTLAELEDDPDYERKMYELDHAGSFDVPLPPGESFTFPDMERYWENVRSNPDFRPELWFLAVKDGEYAGVSMLFHRPADNDLNTGFTTVKRAHRHKGVALALKVAALTHAKNLGKTAVRTENAQTNRSMLGINEALGFEKMPAWIDLVKVLRKEN
ncbi:MAG: GCN5 family acetyltransferase [Meiothermus sp.]|uniref:GNAT family N-acetyltransferase n=1 Tax=Meiothermus sp. TaxID=1955249 RepID=UPI0021DCF107|nr:GNAT family N-acetyltransferase [Meiothermus sp.]GIW29463.1 MAG: GCN5 family acetyltransferase [Meiothermus sp.]